MFLDEIVSESRQRQLQSLIHLRMFVDEEHQQRLGFFTLYNSPSQIPTARLG